MALQRAVNKCTSSDKQDNESNDDMQIDAHEDGSCDGKNQRALFITNVHVCGTQLVKFMRMRLNSNRLYRR